MKLQLSELMVDIADIGRCSFLHLIRHDLFYKVHFLNLI
jgi:hypothetical protein